MMNDSSKFITLRKVGGFYHCFDNDAYILFYFFDYKISNGRVGFPLSSLPKIIAVLNDNKVNYIIINSNDDVMKKDFKKANKYSCFLKLGFKKYKLSVKREDLEVKIKQLPKNKVEELYKIVEDFVNEC